MYNKGLFHKWVPKPIMLLLIVILLVPVLTVSAVYTGNITDMVGTLGTMSESISLANNASAIGMAAAFPLLLRTKRYFRSKELMVGSLVILAFLALVCGTTDNANIIVVCALLMGFFKMFAMIELIIPVMGIIGGERWRFYAFFYPISIGLGQLSGYFTTLYAYNQQWQHVYIISSVVLLVCALICVIFMHNLRPGKQIPLAGFDWLSVGLFSLAFMLLNYVLVFARQQAWYASENIQGATVGFVVFLGLFIYRQSVSKAPNLPLEIFKKTNVVHALIMIFLMGIFMGSAAIQSAFSAILGYDNPTNAELNLAMVPGGILAAVLGFYWFKNKWPMKGYVLIGFLSFYLYTLIMYFMIAPVIDIEYLLLPNFLRGLGMTVLFIGLGLYGLNNLSMQQTLAVSTVLITIRSFLGTAFFGAIYSWAMYKLQWQHVGDLAVNMDGVNTINQARGNGMALYGTVQVQAVLSAAKELFGYILIAGIPVMVYVAVHRFNPVRRRLVVASKIIAGQSVKGYRLHGRNKMTEEVADVAAAAV
jgi:DHA2 family multidrug resistance protein